MCVFCQVSYLPTLNNGVIFLLIDLWPPCHVSPVKSESYMLLLIHELDPLVFTSGLR